MRPVRLSKRVEHPSIPRLVVGGISVAVDPRLEGRIRPTADGGRDKDPVTPNYRTGMAETGNRRTPQDVLTGSAIPTVGKILPLGDASCLRAAERGPASNRTRGRRQRGPRCRTGAHKPAHRIQVDDSLWQPAAAVDNHAAHWAHVGDHPEGDVPTIGVEPVSARGAAFRWATWRDQLISLPLMLHLPLSVGQPSPSSVKDASTPNCTVKTPNLNGPEGNAPPV